MARRIIEIDEEKCDGCGLCVPACHEGAMRIIDGKARLVSEGLCDGLGDCVGECPQGAIRIVEKPAAPAAPMPNHASATASAEASSSSRATAHRAPEPPSSSGGCPGSRLRVLGPAAGVHAGSTGCPSGGARGGVEAAATTDRSANTNADAAGGDLIGSGAASQLSHWPLKIRLVPPHAPFLHDADVVVTADCVPVALPGFHESVVPGRAVLIGCPKFESPQAYAEHFAGIFAQAPIRSLTALIMEVPCCGGLPMAMLHGLAAAGLDLEIQVVVVGLDGQIRSRRTVRPSQTGTGAR